MVWMTILLACWLALSFASSTISLIYEAASSFAWSFKLSIKRFLASSELRPESSSSFIRSCSCIFSRSCCLICSSFFSLSTRCCCWSTSCLRRLISSWRWFNATSRCFKRFSPCWIFNVRCWTSFSSSLFLLRNFSLTSRSFFSLITSAAFSALSIVSLYFPVKI